MNVSGKAELCSMARKRLFSGDDKVSDDARSRKLLKNIKHLWESKHSGRVEVVIGNMAIKTDSMKRLQSAWLDDDVMEGVLKALILKAKKKIVVLSPVYSTMWFWNGRFRQSTSSKLANAMIDQSFITVVNVHENHWLKAMTLKLFMFFDSFGKEPMEYILRIKKHFGSFFRHYRKTTSEWRYCCRKRNEQKDFMNCGPLALMVKFQNTVLVFYNPLWIQNIFKPLSCCRKQNVICAKICLKTQISKRIQHRVLCTERILATYCSI
ncbi:unnamed protein product [Clavelina lepadiformis]|uniref:Ubiquitin-like protease family profile domain-containing protein n=1 Tax=Clavelina lepadiformis TaxID=159417 RepID=A0ABP0FYV9_CLALP